MSNDKIIETTIEVNDEIANAFAQRQEFSADFEWIIEDENKPTSKIKITDTYDNTKQLLNELFGDIYFEFDIVDSSEIDPALYPNLRFELINRNGPAGGAEIWHVRLKNNENENDLLLFMRNIMLDQDEAHNKSDDEIHDMFEWHIRFN